MVVHRLDPRLAVLVVSFCLAGCGTVEIVPVLPASSRIAVRAPDRAPVVQIEGFTANRVHGFANGMGNTFAACFQAYGQGACLNSGCGAMVLFLLGTCGTLSVVGGLVGALDPGADAGKHAAARSVDHALNVAPAQLQLRDRLIAEAGRHGVTLVAFELAPAPVGDGVDRALPGIDIVLEAELTRVGTDGPGGSAPSQLYMEARTRLIRADDQRVLAVGEYRVEGRRYSSWEWQANGGAMLLEGFQQAYGALAEKIYRAHFLH